MPDLDALARAPRTAAKIGPSAPRRGFASRLLGYDIFLSFALGPPPRGTQSYASDLARRLRERDFTVFFSEEEAPPGAELDETLRAGLLHSKALVVIANRGTLEAPRWVRKETELFRKHYPNRPVIVVNIGGALQDSTLAESADEWLGYQGKIWIDESEGMVANGLATESVVERLSTAPARIKSNVWWRWIVRGVVFVLAVLAIGLSVSLRQAIDRGKVAFSRQLSAQAQTHLERELDLALLLSVESLKAKETPEARSAMLTAINYSPSLNTILAGDFIAFGTDSKSLALRQSGGQIALWDVSNPRSARKLGEPFFGPDRVDIVTFSPDMHLMATALTGDTERRIILWDVSNPTKPIQMGAASGAHTRPVRVVTFSPNRNIMVSIDYDSKMIVWDVTNPNSPIRLGEPLTGREEAIFKVAFSPDSKKMVSVSDDGSSILWDITNPRHPINLGELGRSYSVAFSPTQEVVAAVIAEGKIILWDIPNTGRPARLGELLTGQDNAFLRMAFSPDGQTIASVGKEGKIILWDISNLRAIKQLGKPVTGHGANRVDTVAFSPDGRTLASSDEKRRTILWDVSRSRFPTQFGVPFGGEDMFYTVAFGHARQTIAAGGKQGKIALWEVSNPELPTRLEKAFIGHEKEVLALALSPDTMTLATGDEEGAIILWDVSNPGHSVKLNKSLSGHEKGLRALAFSPDGNTLASGDGRGAIILWDTSNPLSPKKLGNPLIVDKPEYQERLPVTSLAFSPNGKTLASSSLWNILWDVSNPSSPTKLAKLTDLGFVETIAFSADKKTMAAGDSEGMVSLWDVSNPRLPVQHGTPLFAHEGWVYAVAFSPDKKTMVSSGLDGIVLWDVTNPRAPIKVGETLAGQKEWVPAVAFGPDSRTVVSANAKLILWDVDSNSWQELACRMANRNLSKLEWDRHLSQFYGEKNYHKTCERLPQGEGDFN